jgi:hypothetical protein
LENRKENGNTSFISMKDWQWKGSVGQKDEMREREWDSHQCSFPCIPGTVIHSFNKYLFCAYLPLPEAVLVLGIQKR